MSLRSVPWFNSKEWDSVYSYLYSSTWTDQLEGIERVKAWANRGRLPHAIDSTANFVQVLLTEQTHPNLSEMELRHLFSMAFVRFVNRLIDPAQKGVYALSMTGIAEQLGLPGWFVDLRHAATHDHLPSLTLLRNGCQQALQWLKENYWSVQLQEDLNLRNQTEKLLEDYKESMKRFIKQSKQGIDSKSVSILTQLLSLLSPNNARRTLFPLLLAPGGLVPLSKQKRITKENDELPHDLIRLWMPLISKCQKQWPDWSSDFIFHSAKVLSNTSPSNTNKMSNGSAVEIKSSKSYSATLCAWMCCIMSSPGFTQNEVQKKLLFDLCVANPSNLFLDILAKKVSEEISPLSSFPSPLLQTKHKIEESCAALSNGWTRADPSTWTPSPIGALPDNDIFSLSVPLEVREKFSACVWSIPDLSQTAEINKSEIMIDNFQSNVDAKTEKNAVLVEDLVLF